MSKITIIDYGIGNILSVKRAFEYCCAEVEIASSSRDILNSGHLVLPGVGAFAHAMRELTKLNLVDSIQKYCEKGNPFLGICLGMQMMMDVSEEFGITKGLELIHGKVVQIPSTSIDDVSHKVPQVGWNKISIPDGKDATWWEYSILNKVHESAEMYFVHSFTAKPDDDSYRLADSYYGGRRISAVIRKDNMYGCQFHPEKSGKVGLNIIKNFVEIK